MIHDGKEPMWVGFNNSRFPYARYGYLPALDPDPPVPMAEPTVYHHRPHQHTYTRKQAGRLFLRMESLEDDMKGFKEYLKKKEAERIAKLSIQQKKKEAHLYE